MSDVSVVPAIVHSIAVCVGLLFTYWMWQRRGGEYVTVLFSLGAGVIVWNSVAVGLAVTSGPWTPVMVGLERFAATITAGLLVAFAAKFTTDSRLSARYYFGIGTLGIIGIGAGIGSQYAPAVAQRIGVSASLLRPLLYGVGGAIPLALFAWTILKFAPTIRLRDAGWKQSAALSLVTFVIAVGDGIWTSRFLVEIAPWWGRIVPPPRFPYSASIAVVAAAVAAFILSRSGLRMTSPFERKDVIDAMDAGIVIVDNDLRLIDYDETAVEIVPTIEWQFGERISELLPDELHATDADRFSGSVDATLGGEERTFAVESAPILSDDARLGSVIIFRDTTEVEAYAADLERQTEQLDEFASVVSHDLRNPIQVARMALGMEEETENIKKTKDALDRMETIIDDALTLARTGRAIEETEMVRLKELVEESWENVDTKRAEMRCTVDSDVEVDCDASRLRNLFENLFRNAIEHGGADVQIEVGLATDGFYVEDDGDGFDPGTDTDELFEKGYTTSDDGTGFGLSIVDSIVKAHGWDIDASNGPSGGARFTVSGVRLSDSSHD